MAEIALQFLLDGLSEILDVTPDKLKSMSLKGKIALEKVKIKQEIFDKLNIDYLKLMSGFIFELNISFSYPVFYASSIEVKIKQLFIHVEQKDTSSEGFDTAKKKLAIQRKLKLKIFEKLLRILEKSSLKYFEKILNLLTFSITDLFIRYDGYDDPTDIEHKEPFVLGIYLQSLHYGKGKLFDKITSSSSERNLLKELVINKLQIYLDKKTEQNSVKEEPIKENKENDKKNKPVKLYNYSHMVNRFILYQKIPEITKTLIKEENLDFCAYCLTEKAIIQNNCQHSYILLNFNCICNIFYNLHQDIKDNDNKSKNDNIDNADNKENKENKGNKDNKDNKNKANKENNDKSKDQIFNIRLEFEEEVNFVFTIYQIELLNILLSYLLKIYKVDQKISNSAFRDDLEKSEQSKYIHLYTDYCQEQENEKNLIKDPTYVEKEENKKEFLQDKISGNQENIGELQNLNDKIVKNNKEKAKANKNLSNLLEQFESEFSYDQIIPMRRAALIRYEYKNKLLEMDKIIQKLEENKASAIKDEKAKQENFKKLNINYSPNLNEIPKIKKLNEEIKNHIDKKNEWIKRENEFNALSEKELLKIPIYRIFEGERFEKQNSDIKFTDEVKTSRYKNLEDIALKYGDYYSDVRNDFVFTRIYVKLNKLTIKIQDDPKKHASNKADKKEEEKLAPVKLSEILQEEQKKLIAYPMDKIEVYTYASVILTGMEFEYKIKRRGIALLFKLSNLTVNIDKEPGKNSENVIYCKNPLSKATNLNAGDGKRKAKNQEINDKGYLISLNLDEKLKDMKNTVIIDLKMQKRLYIIFLYNKIFNVLPILKKSLYDIRKSNWIFLMNNIKEKFKESKYYNFKILDFFYDNNSNIYQNGKISFKIINNTIYFPVLIFPFSMKGENCKGYFLNLGNATVSTIKLQEIKINNEEENNEEENKEEKKEEEEEKEEKEKEEKKGNIINFFNVAQSSKNPEAAAKLNNSRNKINYKFLFDPNKLYEIYEIELKQITFKISNSIYNVEETDNDEFITLLSDIEVKCTINSIIEVFNIKYDNLKMSFKFEKAINIDINDVQIVEIADYFTKVWLEVTKKLKEKYIKPKNDIDSLKNEVDNFDFSLPGTRNLEYDNESRIDNNYYSSNNNTFNLIRATTSKNFDEEYYFNKKIDFNKLKCKLYIEVFLSEIEININKKLYKNEIEIFNRSNEVKDDSSKIFLTLSIKDLNYFYFNYVKGEVKHGMILKNLLLIDQEKEVILKESQKIIHEDFQNIIEIKKIEVRKQKENKSNQKVRKMNSSSLNNSNISRATTEKIALIPQEEEEDNEKYDIVYINIPEKYKQKLIVKPKDIIIHLNSNFMSIIRIYYFYYLLKVLLSTYLSSAGQDFNQDKSNDMEKKQKEMGQKGINESFFKNVIKLFKQLQDKDKIMEQGNQEAKKINEVPQTIASKKNITSTIINDKIKVICDIKNVIIKFPLDESKQYTSYFLLTTNVIYSYRKESRREVKKYTDSNEIIEQIYSELNKFYNFMLANTYLYIVDCRRQYQIFNNCRFSFFFRSRLNLEEKTIMDKCDAVLEPLSLNYSVTHFYLIGFYLKKYMNFNKSLEDRKNVAHDSLNNLLKIKGSRINFQMTKELLKKIKNMEKKSKVIHMYNISTFNRQLTLFFHLDKLSICLYKKYSDGFIQKYFLLTFSNIKCDYITNKDPSDTLNMANALVEILSSRNVPIEKFNLNHMHKYFNCNLYFNATVFNPVFKEYETLIEQFCLKARLVQVAKFTRQKWEIKCDDMINLNISPKVLMVLNHFITNATGNNNEERIIKEKSEEEEEEKRKVIILERNTIDKKIDEDINEDFEDEEKKEYRNSSSEDEEQIELDKNNKETNDLLQAAKGDLRNSRQIPLRKSYKLKQRNQEQKNNNNNKNNKNIADKDSPEIIPPGDEEDAYIQFSNETGSKLFFYFECNTDLKYVLPTGTHRSLSYESLIFLQKNYSDVTQLKTNKISFNIEDFSEVNGIDISTMKYRIYKITRRGSPINTEFIDILLHIYEHNNKKHVVFSSCIQIENRTKFNDLSICFEKFEKKIYSNSSLFIPIEYIDKKSKKGVYIKTKQNEKGLLLYENFNNLLYVQKKIVSDSDNPNLESNIDNTSNNISNTNINGVFTSPTNGKSFRANDDEFICIELFPFEIKDTNEFSQTGNRTILKIVIVPPIKIENQIPSMYPLYFIDKQNKIELPNKYSDKSDLNLKLNEDIDIYSIDPSEKYFLIKLCMELYDNDEFNSHSFNIYEVKDDIDLIAKNSNKVKLSIISEKGYETENYDWHLLKINRNKASSISFKFIFYFKYIIVNKSSDILELIPLNTNLNISYVIKEKSLTLLSLKSKEIVFKYLNKVSDPILIDTIGLIGTLNWNVKKEKKSLDSPYLKDEIIPPELSVTIKQMKYFPNTTIIILQKKYVIINKLGDYIKIWQILPGNEYKTTILEPEKSYEISSYLSTQCQIGEIGVKPEGKIRKYANDELVINKDRNEQSIPKLTSWSEIFDIGTIANYDVKIIIPQSEVKAYISKPNIKSYDNITYFILIRVSIQSLDQATIFITISLPEFPLLEIYNQTDVPIEVSVSQKDLFKIFDHKRVPFSFNRIDQYDRDIICSVQNIDKHFPFNFSKLNKKEYPISTKVEDGKAITNVLSINVSTINKGHTRLFRLAIRDRDDTVVNSYKKFLLNKKNKSRAKKFDILLKGIGISIINDRSIELLYASFYDIDLKISNKIFKFNSNVKTLTNYFLYIKNIQIDYNTDSGYKVIFRPKYQLLPVNEEEINKDKKNEYYPFIQTCLTKKSNSNLITGETVTKYQVFDFIMQEFEINLDQNIIMEIVYLFRNYYDILKIISKAENPNEIISQILNFDYLTQGSPFSFDDFSTSKNVDSNQVNSQNMNNFSNNQIILIKYLFFSGIKCNLNINYKGTKSQTKYINNRIIDIISELSKHSPSTICLNEMMFENLYIRVDYLIYFIYSQLKNQFINQVYSKIIASNLLKNPIRLIDSIGSGFIELINSPRVGFVFDQEEVEKKLGNVFNEMIPQIVENHFGSVVHLKGTLKVLCLEKIENEPPKKEQNENEDSSVLKGNFVQPYKEFYTEGVDIKGFATTPIVSVVSLFKNTFSTEDSEEGSQKKNTVNPCSKIVMKTNPKYKIGKIKTIRFRFPRTIYMDEVLSDYNFEISEVRELLDRRGIKNFTRIILCCDIKKKGDPNKCLVLIITDMHFIITDLADEAVFFLIKDVVDLHIKELTNGCKLSFELKNKVRKKIFLYEIKLAYRIYNMFEKIKPETTNDVNKDDE